MNAYLVCMVAVLSADAPADAWQTASPWDGTTVVRAQGPGPETYPFDGGMPPGGMGYPPPGGAYGADPGMSFMPNPSQSMMDPFMYPGGGHPGGAVPFVAPDRGQFAMSTFGYQPFHIGGQSRADAFYMSSEGTSEPSFGRFGMSGVNAEAEYTNISGLGWIFSTTAQYGVRWWDGPDGGVGLPGDVHRIGLDLEWATPRGDLGPWGLQFGFNPSMNTSFERSMSSDAYQWDVRGLATYEVSPDLLLVGGAGLWDRVRDRVIPYAGVVWMPSDRWELRILFPESQISYFLGNRGAVANWIYLRGEYRVEAYEVATGVGPFRDKDQVETQDWRILFGYQADGGFCAGFIEAGWVFGRDVEFKHDTQPGFDIGSGFIARTGFRF
ncbi:MAG: hypothetical protein WD066_18110 [Planctomycetaceae bacterium]